MSSQLDAEAQHKLQELQILEHNLQNILAQKQAFQMELNESLNALGEVKNSSEQIYKMVGSIIVSVEKNATIKELEEKKKLLEMRNDSLTKQEQLLETKARELQHELKKLIDKKSPSLNNKQK
ncbi:MAG: prefoldin subunit beta [Nanoarchaeota archaeon]